MARYLKFSRALYTRWLPLRLLCALSYVSSPVNGVSRGWLCTCERDIASHSSGVVVGWAASGAQGAGVQSLRG